MDLDILFYILSPVVLTVTAIILYVVTHRSHCQHCHETVWTKNHNCDPCGTNPLNIHMTVKKYYCKACGSLGHR